MCPGFKRSIENHLAAHWMADLAKVFRVDRLPRVLLLDCVGRRLAPESVALVWLGSSLL